MTTFHGINIEDLYVKVTTYQVWEENDSGSGYGASSEHILESFNDKKKAEEFIDEYKKNKCWAWLSIRKSEDLQKVSDYLYLKEYDRNKNKE